MLGLVTARTRLLMIARTRPIAQRLMTLVVVSLKASSVISCKALCCVSSGRHKFEQKDAILWDLELNSGHSYNFTPSQQTCKAIDFPVGILRPTWLKGATPLGPSNSWDESGRIVCGYTKVDFIDYYIDAKTGVPDSWYFHTMKATFQVLNYTANPTIDPALFVPPEYCSHHPVN